MDEPQGFTQEVVDILNSKLGQSITQAFTAGEEQERERIIKLLKEMAKSTFPGDVWHINPFDYAIALIKGETE